MRSAGCVYNDIVDRDLDRRVERTRLRPLASGRVSLRAAWMLIAHSVRGRTGRPAPAQSVAAIVALVSIAPVAAYPFMKRITWWPQAWLGLVFSWGALVGWPAVTGRLGWPALLLWFGSIAWVVGYDTLYAIQDVEDDALVGVKSSARRLGDKAPLGIAFFYALALVLWGAAIWLVRPDWLALACARPRGAAPRQPGAASRSQGWRARAAAVPLQPHLRVARVSRHAGRRAYGALGARLMQSPEDARRIAESLVERGIAAGATAADALYIGERSSGVQVRLGELEDVSRSEGEQIGLRLFDGQRSATVASSDLSDEALGVLVERCLAMAREAPEDPYAGLAPQDLLQSGEPPSLDALRFPRARSRRASRARSRSGECRSGRVRGHQLQRRWSERLGLDHCPRDVGRLCRRIPHQRSRLLGGGRGRRGRIDAARLCVAQRPSSRRPRSCLGDRPESRDSRRRSSQSHPSQAGKYPVLFDPRVSPSPARPFCRRDLRRVDRAADELPPGQARRPGVRERSDDRR